MKKAMKIYDSEIDRSRGLTANSLEAGASTAKHIKKASKSNDSGATFPPPQDHMGGRNRGVSVSLSYFCLHTKMLQKKVTDLESSQNVRHEHLSASLGAHLLAGVLAADPVPQIQNLDVK